MDGRISVAVFGQASKGETSNVYTINSHQELFCKIGDAPEGSKGIQYALEALDYGRRVYFIPVREEGCNSAEYYVALPRLFNLGIDAVYIPGGGSFRLIEDLLQKLKAVILISESDAYDYLTSLYSSN